MNKEQYREYLKSDHWFTLRQKCLAQYGRCCSACKAHGLVEVHHLNYRNIFDVKVSDLRPLCPACHEQIHEQMKKPFSRRRVRTGYQIFKKMKRQILHFKRLRK